MQEITLLLRHIVRLGQHRSRAPGGSPVGKFGTGGRSGVKQVCAGVPPRPISSYVQFVNRHFHTKRSGFLDTSSGCRMT